MHGKVFGANEPFKETNVAKAAVNTRRALTWELTNGRKGVKTRLVAKGYEGRDLKDRSADTPWMRETPLVSSPGDFRG